MEQKDIKKIFDLPPELTAQANQKLRIGAKIAKEIKNQGYTFSEFAKLSEVKEKTLRKIILGEDYNIKNLHIVCSNLNLKIKLVSKDD